MSSITLYLQAGSTSGIKNLKKGKGDATVELEVGNWNEENGR